MSLATFDFSQRKPDSHECQEHYSVLRDELWWILLQQLQEWLPWLPTCCFAGGYCHPGNLGCKECVTPQFPHGKPGCLLTFTSAGFLTGFLTGFALLSLQGGKQRLSAASGGNLLQKDRLAEGGSSWFCHSSAHLAESACGVWQLYVNSN